MKALPWIALIVLAVVVALDATGHLIPSKTPSDLALAAVCAPSFILLMGALIYARRAIFGAAYLCPACRKGVKKTASRCHHCQKEPIFPEQEESGSVRWRRSFTFLVLAAIAFAVVLGASWLIYLCKPPEASPLDKYKDRKLKTGRMTIPKANQTLAATGLPMGIAGV
jgi:hypothetical protein